jgi:ABC-type branched-subunit amino acid transport system ATPase component
LRGVNFHVDRGEAVAIIRENGAGKTTLLKVRAVAPAGADVLDHLPLASTLPALRRR